MPALTLGYKASAEQFPPQRLLDLAVAAEAAGFDSVWTSDHFQPWRHTDGHAPNALVWLGAATQATKRVVLGTSVLTPSFRYNPAIVAQAFATLGCLAPGPRDPGRGHRRVPQRGPGGRRLAGAERAVRAPAGVRAADPGALGAGRGARRLRGRRTTGPTTRRSTTARTSPCRSTSRPPGRPPRASPGASATASSAPAARARSCTPRRCCRRWRRGRRRPAGTPSALDRMIEMKVSFDTDLEPGDGGHEGLGGPRAHRRAEDGHPRRRSRWRSAAKEAEPYAHRRWLVSADPDEHVEQIAPYLAYGFNHLVFHFPGPDQEAAIARYGELILPRLRARFGA